MFQASSDSGSGALGAGLGVGFMLVWLAIVVLMVASMWKIFVKAGKPGWAAIIPIYNTIVLLEIAGKPLWWFILLLLPIVNLVVAIMVMASVARKFGKGIGYALGMIFLFPIFLPMLAFGDSTYSPAA
jgi:hypothetical protein